MSESIILVEVYGKSADTGLASLFKVEDDPFAEKVWIPRSQIKDSSLDDDGSGWIEIPEWLAVEKGLL